MSSLVEVKICDCPCTLDPWDLIKWIIIKVRAGSQLTATAEYLGKTISGKLRPYSINRTQAELTMTCLVDLLTEEGTYTFNCKYLKEIDILPLED